MIFNSILKIIDNPLNNNNLILYCLVLHWFLYVLHRKIYYIILMPTHTFLKLNHIILNYYVLFLN